MENLLNVNYRQNTKTDRLVELIPFLIPEFK